MQLRLIEPFYQTVNHVRLTEFPTDDQFINPGIGVQMFDFFVPLHGKEDYELKKKTQLLPASLEEKNVTEANSEKNKLKGELTQEGFGKKDNFQLASNQLLSQKGLTTPILNAMKHAKIKTNQLKYIPQVKKKKSVQKGAGNLKTKSLKDKFKLI